ncbi:hypothetical protein HDF19_06085 [Mucilaginibacter sp. E4BP6]|uniref:hypothetical protein n=1 Tax=Mucilaginibacter sp. E4BP6 TaxID=2723089 RepID=UPI0015CB251A|nr:hypothetical protein [Mucilaginibacter sp. E4BP6]NYE68395.1 hypothetical protein [Mucilaginibacter sp. E4BP6]
MRNIFTFFYFNTNRFLSQGKKIRVLAFTILLLLLVHESKGQASVASFSLPTITPPSPNATSLGIYGQYPISFSTGVPQINIPIYVIKSSRLTLPIGLSYHANGIKVNEFASNVGLGFSLNAGGAITEQINDLPDFAPYGNGYSNLVIPSPNPLDLNYNYTYSDAFNYYCGMTTLHPVGSMPWTTKYDSQPDNFYFNFNDKAGMFMLKNTQAPGMPFAFATVPYQPLKIGYNQTNNRFTIQDVDGTTYVFGNSVKDNSNAVETTTTNSAQTNITGYLLTEMISADHSDTISFKYSSSGTGETYNSHSALLVNQNAMAGGGQSLPLPAYDTTYNSSGTTVDHSNLDIAEIDFKSGKAVFEYSSRLDLSSQRLTRIRIYNYLNGKYNELKRYNFGESYFGIGNSGGATLQIDAKNNNQRLRLDSLWEEGLDPVTGVSTDKRPYVFNYYGYNGTPSVIPSIGTYQQDLWGYWNGRGNSGLHDITANLIIGLPGGTPADRAPDSTCLITGTIQSIKYPTGGQTQFQFEPNKITQSNNLLDTVFTNIVLLTIGGYGTGVTDQTFTVPGTPGGDTTVTVQFTATLNNCTQNCVANSPAVFMYDLANSGNPVVNMQANQSSPSNFPFRNTQTVTLVKGHQYRIYFPDPNPANDNKATNLDYNLTARLSFISAVNVVPNTTLVLTGGLRIKRIINTDAQNNILTTKRYNYLNPYFISPNIFQGNYSLVFGTNYAFPTNNGALSAFVYQTLGPAGVVYKTLLTENSTIPLAGASNGGLAYAEVEEYDDDSNGSPLGKTVYDFNRVTDDNYDMIFSAKTDRSWRRSQMIEKRIYKQNAGTYTLLNDLKNTYSDLFTNGQDTIKSFIIHRLFDDDDWDSVDTNFGSGVNLGTSPAPFVFLIDDSNSAVSRITTYNIWSSFQVASKNALTSAQTTQYDSNGQNPIVKTTNYIYSNPVSLLPGKETTIQSNGNTQIDSSIYTVDYPIDQCKPGACYANLLTQLASIRANFYQQSNPIYLQWLSLVETRYNMQANCPTIPADCNFTINDAQITTLFNQYANLKTTLNTAIAQAVTNYTNCLNSYSSCNTSQLQNATANNSALLQMQQQNILEEVEHDRIIQQYATNQSYLSGAEKTLFQTVNNMAEPQQAQKAEFTGEILFSTYAAQPTNYLKTRIIYDHFDNYGNILQYTKDNGPQVSYQWGYNEQYPVAQVANAKSNDIFYDGFEEGDGTSTAGNAHTGHFSYMGTTAYTKALSSLSGGSYILCYWVKSVTTGAWSQVSTILSGLGTSYTITIPAGNQIDDVRFYPSSAQMTTYTYDPLVGMTSSIDTKGERIYYEYDGFQRLINIKDKDGNIIKHMSYHYQGQ